MPHVIRPPKHDKRLLRLELRIANLYMQFNRIRNYRNLNHPMSEENYNLQLDVIHADILKLRQLRLDYEPPK